MKSFIYHRNNFVYFYGICIALFFIWLYFNGLLLHQLNPILFINRLDFSLNLLHVSGLTQLVIKSYSAQFMLDVFFLLLPLSLLLSFKFNWKIKKLLAVLVCFFCWVYGLLNSSVSSLSVEGFAAFTLVPLLFTTDKEKNYYFLFNILRYAFIIIFFSTALWKLRAGGLLNLEQMSGILVNQHSSLLAENTSSHFTGFLKYLINHPTISWLLYAIGFFIEFFFIAGLFTKKLDRLLLLLLISFFVMDYFLMQINYMSWLPFAGLLYFSRFTSLPLPEKNKKISNTLSS